MKSTSGSYRRCVKSSLARALGRVTNGQIERVLRKIGNVYPISVVVAPPAQSTVSEDDRDLARILAEMEMAEAQGGPDVDALFGDAG